MRTLAITQNITLDGSIEMLGDWFDPQGPAEQDTSDLQEELLRRTIVPENERRSLRTRVAAQDVLGHPSHS